MEALEQKGEECQSYAQIECKSHFTFVCGLCGLLNHLHGDCYRAQTHFDGMPSSNITYSEEEKYIKELKLPESGYQIMKIMRKIMDSINEKYVAHRDIENSPTKDKFTILHVELLLNGDFIEKQLYSSVFGSEQDRILKLLRRINNQILSIKSFFSQDLPTLLTDPAASTFVVEFVTSQLQSYSIRKQKINELVLKALPKKEIVSSLEEAKIRIESSLQEVNKKDITYEQIGQLYAYCSIKNAETQDSSLSIQKFDENGDIELGVHSSQYQKILIYLSNFFMPHLNGLMITGIKHNNEVLKRFYSEGIIHPLNSLHFSASSRLKVSIEEYLSVMPKVTQKVCFGWFHIHLKDFEELMKAAMNIQELILERGKIYIPKNTILAMSEADKTYFNGIQETQIDLQFDKESRLEILNLYDVLFTEEAFNGLITAMNLSPIGQSLKELRLHRLGIPKDDIFQMTSDCKFKVVF